jgi:hypothetical protein
MASALGYDAALAETKLKPSLIIDLRAASYSQDPEEYSLPGFQVGGEGGLADEGLSLGHTEFSMSGIFADKLEGKFTAVIHHHMNEVEADMEELWLQTVGLGNGLTFKGGRFFSDIGYLNNKHPHMWDFADEPLVYRGTDPHTQRRRTSAPTCARPANLLALTHTTGQDQDAIAMEKQ